MANTLRHITEEIRKQIHPFRFHQKGKQEVMNQQIRQKLSDLSADDDACGKLRNQIQVIAKEANFVNAFTESGIFSGSGLLSEILRRISLSLLPEVYSPHDFRGFIQRVFFKNNDFKWLNALDEETIQRLWTILNKDHFLRKALRPSIANSLVVLSHRIAVLGLENELADKMPELDKLDSPFMEQSASIIHLVSIIEKEQIVVSTHDSSLNEVLSLLQKCEDIIQTLREKRNEYGISFSLSLILVRLKQMIIRMRLLLDIVVDDDEKNRMAFFCLFSEIVKSENNRYSIRYYVGKNSDLIAYQVTEHASKSGSHYITSDVKGYWQLFRDSMQGGVFVGFMALFKILIYYLRISPFGYAFMYSLNYASGFVGMHLTHSALATKQPALTAQALATSIDKDKSGNRQFAQMTAKIFRSQFVSFMGNLVVVFPLGLCIALLYSWLMPEPLTPDEKAMQLLNEIHPFHSRSLIYAGIAGFYLFLSGLLSGYIENLVVYAVLKERIVQHPIFSRWIKHGSLSRLAGFVDRNAGGIVGNAFFGLCMGSTPIIGSFFGLDLDVRHITFAAANSGIALGHFMFDVPLLTIIMAFVGVSMIGFTNFMVSFLLSFMLAVKARSISLSGYKYLLIEIWQLFKRRPRTFFFPPRSSV